jgi:SAM-dependent methyltransferase
MASKDYVLSSGRAGRERLRILGRVTSPGTNALFDRIGVRPGMRCLDVGCGGGDVSLLLAQRVGDTGRVTGADVDSIKLGIAADEAAEVGASNVEFRAANVFELAEEIGEIASFDLVYSRFLLTHLRDSQRALRSMTGMLRPGGIIAIEDIDFSGHFSYPDCPALWDYVRLYTATSARTGGDANIGPRLPILLLEAGMEDVSVRVSQPAGVTDEAKLINPITMESVAERTVAEGLATSEEVGRIVRELYAAVADPQMVMSIARIVQAWARKP